MSDDGRAFWVGIVVGAAFGLVLGSAFTAPAGRHLFGWGQRLADRLFGGGPGVRFDLMLQ